MGVRSSEDRPLSAVYQQLEQGDREILERAAAVAVDKATRLGAAQIKNTMRARGLGRLSNAVGVTTSLQRGKKTGSNAWGAIFAKGGDDSLAGGALEIYGRGGAITPKFGAYVWFQTAALKRRVGRYRMTPQRYIDSGSPLGPLLFRRKNARIGEFFVKGAVTSAKNGRARLPGPRSKARGTIVVLFVGVKSTTRLARFNKDQIVSLVAGLVPAYMVDEIAAHFNDR
jgi:hypothetical protein